MIVMMKIKTAYLYLMNAEHGLIPAHGLIKNVRQLSTGFLHARKLGWDIIFLIQGLINHG
ncbi:hypothetical protein AWN66_04805 [Klebsiella pneumoniae subsp. pneumoniae]|nr:hypothetical protein AWN66_04805 [Klebsiella pneumoniae subsp. pneumoniae]